MELKLKELKKEYDEIVVKTKRKKERKKERI